MKILFLTQNLPYPPDSGGKIKTYKTLELLSRQHTLFLVCFIAATKELVNVPVLEQMGIRVFPVIFPQTILHFSKMRRFILKSLFSPLPFLVYRHHHHQVLQIITGLLGTEKIDAIHVDHLAMAQYLPSKKRHLWVLEEHNLDSQQNRQIFLRENWNKFKLFSLLEWVKMRFYEKRMIPKFDYWLAISKKDREQLLADGARAEATYFFPVFFRARDVWRGGGKQKSILFLGSLAWWPNKSGLFWFIDKILPLISQRIPQTTLRIIGRDDSDVLFNFVRKKKNITLLGHVRKLEPYLRSSKAFIVPLRTGSGIRIKVLTALASGVPVVSTSKGIEGIEVTSGKEVLVADKEREFAEKTIQALTRRDLAEGISQAGQKFVQRHYSQQTAKKVLAQIYHA